MNIHELSDLDADALTITTRGRYTWVTCTADGEEVTVGPVQTRKLSSALPRYSDDMDGGVTAALIEKEAEDHGGPLDETVDFWRARWKEAADRADARDLAAHQWKEATREHVRRSRTAASYADMCRTALDDTITRAEQAEKERDEARATKNMHKARADEERARAVAAELRPFTPGDITEEMVKRAQRAYPLSPSTVRDMLTAALTTPARPEGAEEIEALIETSPWHLAGSCSAEADWLAERGVRVVTEEQP